MTMLWDEANKLIAEQLVLVIGYSPHAEADAHRLRALDLYCSDGRLVTQHKRAILLRLSNGDVGKRGSIERSCRGCCRDKCDALRQLLTVGVRAVLGTTFRVVARCNWTGTTEAMHAIGLATAICGVLPHVFLRATHATVAQPTVGSAEDGAGALAAAVGAISLPCDAQCVQGLPM